MNTEVMKAKLTVVKILIDELEAEINIQSLVDKYNVRPNGFVGEAAASVALDGDTMSYPEPDPTPEPVPEMARPPKAGASDEIDFGINWSNDGDQIPRGTKFNASLLRQQRAREAVTQDGMSEAMSIGQQVSGPTISALETGTTKRPTVNTIKCVAAFFGISPRRYVISAEK